MAEIPGPVNIAGATLYIRDDKTLGLILPSGREVILTAAEAREIWLKIEKVAMDVEFERIVSGDEKFE